MMCWRSGWLSIFRKGATSGFTIIELVTVMAVMLFAIGIGFYSMGAWRERSEFSGIVNGMRNAIHLTRSRAIARQKPVVLQIKRMPLSGWKSSENYLIIEMTNALESTSDEKKTPYYWVEFQFVDAVSADFSAGDPASPEAIDGSLSTVNDNVMKRGQICFDGRGYAVKPPCTWKPILADQCAPTPPTAYYPLPQEYEIRLVATSIGRQINLRISFLGQISAE